MAELWDLWHFYKDPVCPDPVWKPVSEEAPLLVGKQKRDRKETVPAEAMQYEQINTEAIQKTIQKTIQKQYRNNTETEACSEANTQAPKVAH